MHGPLGSCPCTTVLGFLSIVFGLCNFLTSIQHFGLNVHTALHRRYRIEILTAVPSMLYKLVTSPLLRNMSEDERHDAFKSLIRVSSGAAYLSGELRGQVSKAIGPDSHAADRFEVIQVSHVSMSLLSFLRIKSLFSEGIWNVRMCELSSFLAPRSPIQGIYMLSREQTLTILPFPIRRPSRAPLGYDASTALSLYAGMEAVLVKDANGRDSLITNPIDQVGELWVRGPNISLGYWRNERATKDAFGLTLEGLDGSDWMRTGDRVCLLCFILLCVGLRV